MRGLFTQVERVMHEVGVGVRVGRVWRVWMVVGGVSQGWMVVAVPSPVTPSGSGSALRSLGRPPLRGQPGFVCGQPVGLWDDDVGVLEEGSGAEAVVVHRLGVGLQVALHVLWIEGEVGA